MAERMFTREELSDLILKAEVLQGLEDEAKSRRIMDLANTSNGI